MASPIGAFPTGIVASTLPVAPSKAVTVSGPRLVAQAVPFARSSGDFETPPPASGHRRATPQSPPSAIDRTPRATVILLHEGDTECDLEQGRRLWRDPVRDDESALAFEHQVLPSRVRVCLLNGRVGLGVDDDLAVAGARREPRRDVRHI